MAIEIVRGSIIDQEVDVIVNTANSDLAGGGGVDGVIHRAGGPSIMDELRQIKSQQGRCVTGSAVITGAGELRANYVVHAVGPIYRGGTNGEPELLYRAYQSSLKLAANIGARSVAFPSISTGAYGYPISEAAPIAIRAVQDFCRQDTRLEIIRFVLFDQATFRAYQDALNKPRCSPFKWNIPLKVNVVSVGERDFKAACVALPEHYGLADTEECAIENLAQRLGEFLSDTNRTTITDIPREELRLWEVTFNGVQERRVYDLNYCLKEIGDNQYEFRVCALPHMVPEIISAVEVEVRSALFRSLQSFWHAEDEPESHSEEKLWLCVCGIELRQYPSSRLH